MGHGKNDQKMAKNGQMEIFGEEYPRVSGEYYSDLSDAEDE